jgi:hypothetical protein
LSTTNSTWTGPIANPDFCGERPATNRVSHVTALSDDTARVFLTLEELRQVHEHAPVEVLVHEYKCTALPFGLSSVKVDEYHKKTNYETGFRDSLWRSA